MTPDFIAATVERSNAIEQTARDEEDAQQRSWIRCRHGKRRSYSVQYAGDWQDVTAVRVNGQER